MKIKTLIRNYKFKIKLSQILFIFKNLFKFEPKYSCSTLIKWEMSITAFL